MEGFDVTMTSLTWWIFDCFWKMPSKTSTPSAGWGLRAWLKMNKIISEFHYTKNLFWQPVSVTKSCIVCLQQQHCVGLNGSWNIFWLGGRHIALCHKIIPPQNAIKYIRKSLLFDTTRTPWPEFSCCMKKKGSTFQVFSLLNIYIY